MRGRGATGLPVHNLWTRRKKKKERQPYHACIFVYVNLSSGNYTQPQQDAPGSGGIESSRPKIDVMDLHVRVRIANGIKTTRVCMSGATLPI